MKKSLLLSALLLASTASLSAESIVLDGKEYEFERKIDRQIGPGTTHLMLRFPSFPLNVNLIMVDLNNPYNRIETTAGKETSHSTESLVKAAERQSYEGHRVVGGANANFWYVSASTDGCNEFVGTPRNVSVRNGKMVTESNSHYDSWTGGPGRQGAVTISPDKVAHINYAEAPMTIYNEKIGTATFHQCNKGVWADEIGIYNSFWGDRQFLPVMIDPITNTYRVRTNAMDNTEVLLDMDEGQRWMGGEDMVFTVKKVTTNTCAGTLEGHDLAIVGRVNNPTPLHLLAEGDKVTLNYSWIFGPNSANPINAKVEQAVGGNAMVMVDGQLTEHNNNESYNSMVYSRTGYGCSADGKTLYIIVIDKATHPIFGGSNGCNTTVMCNIAQHFGCSFMSNMDAGGSAEMLVYNQIFNKTTEGTPRAVANGMFVYSIAPEDDRVVSSLAFYDQVLEQPIYASASPAVIAYDQYGAVIDYDYKDIVFTCDEAIGTCEGNVFVAGADGATGVLTASCGDVSVSKEMTVVSAEVTLRAETILIDSKREYPIEVTASNAGKTYSYDPSHLTWTVEDPTIATIDENGVLRGIANGSTKISGTIGRFTDEATVTVEIASAPELKFGETANWTVKGSSGITNVKMDENGATSFTYGTARSPYLEYKQDAAYYSLPDRLRVDFNSPLAVKSLQLVLGTNDGEKDTTLKLEPEEAYAAGTDYSLQFDLTELKTDDICIFPLSLTRFRVTFVADAANKGDHTFNFGGLYGEYDWYNSVEDVRISDELTTKRDALRLSNNPAQAGSSINVNAHGITAVAVYSISGTLVSKAEVAQCESAVIEAPAVAGTYVVSAQTAAGHVASVLIVK